MTLFALGVTVGIFIGLGLALLVAIAADSKRRESATERTLAAHLAATSAPPGTPRAALKLGKEDPWT